MSVTAFETVVAIVLDSLFGSGLVLTVVYGYYRAQRKSSDAQDVWDLIPEWQYPGLHVASGGLTRGEQERAIQEVQELADELERQQSHEGDDEPSPYHSSL